MRRSVLRACRKKHSKLCCYSFLQAAGGALPTVTSGWVLAGSILAAVRLARKQIEDDKVRKLQVLYLAAMIMELRVAIFWKATASIILQKIQSGLAAK